MKNNPYDRFIYLPVGADQMPFLEHCESVMLNVTRPVPEKHINKLKSKVFICNDSGGLQGFEAEKQGKIFIVGPMLKTIMNDPSVFTLGTINNCLEYNRTNSNTALMIDRPTFKDDSDAEYHMKLLESRKTRDRMLKAAPYLCPDTKLIIALQPRNPLEIKNYYGWICTPHVNSYAFPIRDFRNKPKDALGNAYVLSFLSSVKIEHIHFLGSNAPPVIFVLAQAIAFDMFPKCSFDSRTWDQIAISGYRYLNPQTLSSVPTKKEGQLHPNDNLRTVLKSHNGLFEAILGPFDPPEWALVEEWLGILNIRIIDHFKDMVLDIALNNDLKHFIKGFPKYGKSKDKIIEALDLLEESKEYGHDFTEKKYSAKIEEMYS